MSKEEELNAYGKAAGEAVFHNITVIVVNSAVIGVMVWGTWWMRVLLASLWMYELAKGLYGFTYCLGEVWGTARELSKLKRNER